MNHFWLVGFCDGAKDPIQHCFLGGEGVGWWAFVWIILTSIQCFTCFMDLSRVFVLQCGISRDKHHLSSDLSVLIHVTVVIPATSCSLLWLLYSTSHNTRLCGPAPAWINTKERKCFFMQHEAVVLQETLQCIIPLSPASVTSKRELEMCTDRNSCEIDCSKR